MKPNLLLIGMATQRMIDQFKENFAFHNAADFESNEAIINALGDKIEAIATNGHDGVPQDLMDACPNLKVISCYGVGYDGINVNRAAERGIMVTHTPNVLNDDVANTAIMLLLAASRCLVRDDAWVRSGNWESKGNAPLTRSIEKSTVGVVGMGRIGETIAKKLKCFDCTVLYHARNKRDHLPYEYFADLKAMATKADHLIIITPGGPSTHHLVNDTIFNALGRDGYVINVARGSVIDENALVTALQEGRIGGAGLDVFDKEPKVPDALKLMENVVLTPHVASATVETRQAMGDLTVDNLVQYFAQGKVISAVPECSNLPSA